jgi:tripeptidyl-peptidase-1
VVAVGGTSLTYNPSTYTRISEVGNPSSGGGVSTLFSRPTYQSTAKANVFFSNNNYSYVTSLTGRGVPDMSAPYQFYPLWYNGNIALISGTSASTPILAGMTAKFISMNQGKRPPVRSFHELLYRADANNGFYDVTAGNNNDFLTVGFAANVGWDAVTGMGVPNATNLYQVITSAGAKIKKTAYNWGYVANVSVKTGSSTWTAVKNIWTKDATGTWKQIF